MEPIKPHPPTRLPVRQPDVRLRPNPIPLTMKQLGRKLLLKLKEGTTWLGFAAIGSFFGLGPEEMDLIWQVVSGLAAVVLVFWDEDKTKVEKEADNG